MLKGGDKMELTTERLQKMSDKLLITKRNSGYFQALYYDTKDIRYLNRSERMNSCLDFWLWDMYEKNKILDLQRVNRCKDRFCPNCRSISLAGNIVKFGPHFRQMLDKGYNPYLITLTVPNVSGDQLKSTVDRIIKSFSKFWRWVSKGKDREGGFRGRLFDVRACVRVLEITVQKSDNTMYHPHLHVLAFLENDSPGDFKKYIDGGFQFRTQQNIFYSDADIHIMKLWYMAYNNISIRNFNSISDKWYDLYICDIRELQMPDGIYEVFKYAFKDSDIKDYENFKYIYSSIEGRRLRQGHGELFNIQVDDEMEDGEEYENIEDYLEEDEKEKPQRLATKTIEELTTIYHSYRKISRFRNWKDVEKIEKNL